MISTKSHAIHKPMGLWKNILACVFVVASATGGSAATYNLGNLTAETTFSERLSVQTVDFLEFSLSAPNGSTVSTIDVSVSTIAGSNFRPIIGLYAGNRLVARDDGGVAGGTARLSFGGFGTSIAGAYTLGIGGWIANFTPDIADVRSTAFFNNGTYDVTLTPTISPVPLPAGGVLLLTALGALALRRRATSRG